MTGVPQQAGPCVVVAGGGTAGHIEPALALADAVMRLRPDARVVALGRERGWENSLVPARGSPLELIPPVPMPRQLSVDLALVGPRLLRAVQATISVLRRDGALVAAGFCAGRDTPAQPSTSSLGLPLM